MPDHRIQVVIADDHPIILDGLSARLVADRALQLVGVAHTFGEVADLLATTLVDVLVLDLGGMGAAPLTVVHRMVRDHPDLAIVVFSSSIDVAPELLQAGVQGYVAKEDLADELLHAISAVARGRPYLSTTVQVYLHRLPPQQPHHLAPKELTVLKQLAHGLGTVAIAEQLGIDPRSVQNYITALRHKLGCAERTQLVDWYRRTYGGAP
jgi:DNA-binding NarL/FixJ family response regulator